MKKYKELLINNFNLSVSIFLLTFASIMFFFSSLKLISFIILMFIFLVVFYFAKDNLKKSNSREESKENESFNNNNTVNKDEYFYDDIMKKVLYIKDYDFVLIIQDTINNIKEVLNCINKNKSYKKMHDSIIDYYIPTITKFIYTYIDLDNCSMEEKNKNKVRLEIKKSICAINYGFDKMKSNIDTNILMDIYSDISVLKAMLLKDGLVKEIDFKN